MKQVKGRWQSYNPAPARGLIVSELLTKAVLLKKLRCILCQLNHPMRSVWSSSKAKIDRL